MKLRGGRPSKSAAYVPEIRAWLAAVPEMTGAEVVRRVQLIAKHTGRPPIEKSCIYAAVRRLRREREEAT